jgi:hypothetical protein
LFLHELGYFKYGLLGPYLFKLAFVFL